MFLKMSLFKTIIRKKEVIIALKVLIKLALQV